MCMLEAISHFSAASDRPSLHPLSLRSDAVRLRPACASTGKLSYSDRGHLAKAPAAGRRGRLGRTRRGCVDVFAVDVLGVAEECCALLTTSVALLETVEFETCMYWSIGVPKAERWGERLTRLKFVEETHCVRKVYFVLVRGLPRVVV